MSSTNKTSNLGLNQWELKDVYQMADFNADNAKIDAAMGLLTESLAGNLKAELLIDFSETRNASGPRKFDMRNVDLGDYFFLVITTNNITSGCFLSSSPVSVVTDYIYTDLTFVYFPLKNGKSYVSGVLMGGDQFKFLRSSVRYDELEEIMINMNACSNTFSVKMWGIK